MISRIMTTLTRLREGSWMMWGAVLLAAGTAGVAEACGSGILGVSACQTADEIVQGLGVFLTVAGVRNAPGVAGS